MTATAQRLAGLGLLVGSDAGGVLGGDTGLLPGVHGHQHPQLSLILALVTLGQALAVAAGAVVSTCRSAAWSA